MFFIPGSLISAVTLPGIVVHELAHQLFCRYYRIPVYEVCYFRMGTPAGYVVHGEAKSWTQQVMISAGPFFINSILGAVLCFPSILRVSGFEGGASILDGVLIWLGISISMHAIPSIGDAKSMWSAVAKQRSSNLAKLCVAPLVGLIYLLSLGSFFWLDLIYGVMVSAALPNLIVEILS